MTNTYNYGYISATREFVLWERNEKGSKELARIPFDDAVAMASTVAHVQSVEAGMFVR